MSKTPGSVSVVIQPSLKPAAKFKSKYSANYVMLSKHLILKRHVETWLTGESPGGHNILSGSALSSGACGLPEQTAPRFKMA